MQTTTRTAWESGIGRELAWWRGYLQTAGYHDPETREEFRFRFDPAAPLQPHLAGLLPATVPVAGIQILDCAAGPATTLGKTLNGERLAITAVDALADHYTPLLAELGLRPPVPSLPCDVEHLDELFPPDHLHLVYMRFALDHCYDPIAALRQMVRVTRPGGVVMVEHYRDASQTEYQGLRHWRLLPEEHDLVIANDDQRLRVSEEVPGVRLEMQLRPDWMTMTLHLP